jgi:hypothetical protein
MATNDDLDALKDQRGKPVAVSEGRLGDPPGTIQVDSWVSGLNPRRAKVISQRMVEVHEGAVMTPLEMLERYVITVNKAHMAALANDMTKYHQLLDIAGKLNDAMVVAEVPAEIIATAELAMILCAQFHAVDIMETHMDEHSDQERGRVSFYDRGWNKGRQMAKEELAKILDLAPPEPKL